MGESSRHALLLGNGIFSDRALCPLEAPAVDAQRLAAVLGDPQIGAFSVEQCIDGTHAEMRRAIGKLCHGRRRDDVVLLYFSGHGLKDDWGHLYLASQDTEKTLFSATSVDVAWLSRQMERCAAGSLVLVLDCCFGGAYEQAPKGGVDVADIRAALSGDGSGRVVLCASTDVQPAWEGSRTAEGLPQSVFSGHLIEGLETGAADLDRDGRIHTFELFEYARQQMRGARAPQEPMLYGHKLTGNIFLTKVPIRTTRTTAPEDRTVCCELEILGGPSPRHTFRLPAGQFRIGRAEDCTIRLKDDLVSRAHAVLEVSHIGVILRDTKSRHGTWIAGRKIAQADLRPGVEIRIGDTLLRWADRSVTAPADTTPSQAERRVVGTPGVGRTRYEDPTT